MRDALLLFAANWVRRRRSARATEASHAQRQDPAADRAAARRGLERSGVLRVAREQRRARLDRKAGSPLQVKIREVDAADDLFDKSISDVVEPRRKFIQDSALSVANLNV